MQAQKELFPQSGFTLVELVVVIVLAGILLATAAPRFFGGTGFEEREFRDRIVASLRYAQKSAIAARRTICASFSASPATIAYRISSSNGAADCTTGSTLSGPEGAPLVVTTTKGVAFSPLPPDITFDAGGRPNGAASIALSGLPSSLNVTVEAETGYVH